MNDQQIKEKMELLNTLSGGIVYGKEDAWDKLQARMDGRNKTITLSAKYWAAAAVVLLSVGIAIFYQQPAIVVANNDRLRIPMPHQQSTASVHTDVKPEDKLQQPITRNTITPHQKNKVRINTIEQKPIAPIVIPPVQSNNIAVTTPAAEPAPAEPLPAPAKPMKVVYIMDAENGEKDRATTNGSFAATNPQTDFKNMPVLHINDVVNDEEHIKAILRENRMTTGHTLFFWRNATNEHTNPDIDQYDNSYPLLKKIFNPQN